MAVGIERLAYETALRALDKQERVLEQLRAHTGVLLAGSSLAASFLGQQAFRHPSSGLVAILALVAFVVSIGAGVYILLPKRRLIFSLSAPALYEGFYAVRGDLPEVYRRLAYDLHRFFEHNDRSMIRLTRAYRLGALSLMLEVVLLVVLVSDTIG